MTDRKKTGVKFWATVVVAAVLVTYPLSWGPACWIATRTHTDDGPVFSTLYWPMGWAIHREIPVIWQALGAYAAVGMRDGDMLHVPSGSKTGDKIIVPP